MSLRYTTATTNAQTELMSRLMSGGRLQLYGGERPENPDEPGTQAPLLGEMRFGAPALGESTNGEAEGVIEGDYVRQDGKLSWFRVLSAEGLVIMDGTIGTRADADLQVDRLTVEQDARLKPTLFSYASPRFNPAQG